MDSQMFINICKQELRKYIEEEMDKSDTLELTDEDIYVVWSAKVLQNNKALLSTNLMDGMYYELTYNGDKNELYLDAYKKWKNKCIK